VLVIVELFSVVGYRLSAAAAVALSIAMITNNSVTHELIAARQTDRHHCRFIVSSCQDIETIAV